jgi:hypothetical protein
VAKRKTSSKRVATGPVQHNGAAIPARPASELNLTRAEIALLEDPDWVTEDEADIIVSARREAEGDEIPIDDVLRRFGHKRKVAT